MEHSLSILRQIVQEASTAASPIKQMSCIVSAVSKAMRVSVCSLYVADDEGLLTLAATEGLDPASVGKVQLREGEGLVGTIALNSHPLNVDDAPRHPDYRYFPETHEEEYLAFLGVPLVYLRRLIGVLVVQERQRRKFSDEEEAFLITVAAQLSAAISLQKTVPAADATGRDAGAGRKVSGVRGAGGIGIGKIHLITQSGLDQVVDREITDIEGELLRFHRALQETRDELQQGAKLLTGKLPDDAAAIFSAYRMLLDSGTLTRAIEAGIRAGNWAAGALRAGIAEYAGVFEAMEDPYLRARCEDIRTIGDKLYARLGGQGSPQLSDGHNLILAGDLVSITDLASYPREQLAGILCLSGSTLSHTAVLANALGIPAVMGTGEIKGLQTGTPAILDGHQGQVILGPSELVLEEYRALAMRERHFIEGLDYLKDQPAVTPDGRRIKLYSNTGLMADISPGLNRGAEGIGLYRSEIPFMQHDSFPTEEEQRQIYRHVLSAYAGKPVQMRTLDIGGDKALPYYRFSEENPYLGWRGIRFTLDNGPIFMTQIRAMLRASEGLNNLRILLPMVSRVDELDAFGALLDDAREQLADEGYRILRPQVGIMVEVPAAVPLLPFFAKRIDFISIGSNDLTQYLLALDRNNPRVSRMFDNLHPAVLKEIHRIVRKGRAFGLKVGLCGEMAADPLAVVLLLGMGIDTLSMSAFNLPKIKWLIRTLPGTVAETLLAKALELEHESDIRQLTRQALIDHGLAELAG